MFHVWCEVLIIVWAGTMLYIPWTSINDHVAFKVDVLAGYIIGMSVSFTIFNMYFTTINRFDAEKRFFEDESTTESPIDLVNNVSTSYFLSPDTIIRTYSRSVANTPTKYLMNLFLILDKLNDFKISSNELYCS